MNYLKAVTKLGIPKNILENIVILPWNDPGTIDRVMKRHEHDVAAVILEPTTPEVQPEEGFLKALREITLEHDALLIFDEVKTGFRLSYGGAQEYFKVTPDLATFSKAMGNGFPISAVVGKREMMDPIATQVQLVGTFNSNSLSMAASLATLNVLGANNGQAYEHLFDIGNKLQKSLRDAIEDVGIETIVQGTGPMFRPIFTKFEKISNIQELRNTEEHPNKKRSAVLSTELLKKGMWPHPDHLWYVSTAHSQEDVDKTSEALEDAFRACKKIV